MKLDALNPRKLAEKYSPKLYAYMQNPKKWLSSLNPLVTITIGVIFAGAFVAGIGVCATKLKEKLPDRLIKMINKVKTLFVFGLLISSLQTGYLNMWISTNLGILQNILDYKEFVSSKKHRKLLEEPLKLKALVKNSLISVCLVIGLTTPLALIIRMIKRNSLEYFDKEETKAKVGALYKNLKTNSKLSLHYTPLFLTRRLFVAGVFVYVENIVLKVLLINLTCCVSIYYLIKNNPFKDPIDWKIEVINEICLFVANLWCLSFSDLLFDSPEEKVKLGWIYFAIIAAMLAINLYYFFKRTVYAYVLD